MEKCKENLQQVEEKEFSLDLSLIESSLTLEGEDEELAPFMLIPDKVC
ncbi:hypothetical protein [Lysinibacillus sp. JNUCC-52]|nr:hypothetical protein JNUCC52_02555 [Lysinibacillus sp. JNUCC-52]